ncbi:MAG: DUF6901 family protein [Coraliomargarita sp.]
MDDGQVRYVIQLDGREIIFDVDPVPHDDISDDENYPEWAMLGHKQCACCPLKESDCKYCPVATRIHPLIEKFSAHKSTERAHVRVETVSRSYVADVDLQSAISSLMGLLMATSGCPILKKLGAMASLHVPFCSTKETLHRSVGSYLTQQYFIQKNGGEPDWELKGLKALYEELGGLNQDFSRRIQGSVESDAMSNAVIIFFATSVLVSTSLEEQLAQYERYLTNSK